MHYCMCIFSLIFLLGNSSAESPESWPKLKKMENGRYIFGGVTIDKNKRVIEFSAVSNQNNGLIEYGIVNEGGKIHESLFRTQVSPQIIHASLLLLKEKPFKDYFEDLHKGRFNENNYINHAFGVEIVWENNGTRMEKNIRELYSNQEKKDRYIKQGVFLFTGSRMIQKTFMAEHTGSILAVYIDQDALFNSTEYDSNNDDVWIARKSEMPPLEIAVTCVFSLPKKLH